MKIEEGLKKQLDQLLLQQTDKVCRLLSHTFHLHSVYSVQWLDTVDADVPALFVANNVGTVTHGHSLKLFLQQSRIDACKFFFLNRVI